MASTAAPFENRQAVHVQYFPSSFNALKAGKISEIEAELVSRLKANTVAAVVAPSITEATRPVIELVRSINPKIPIMLESSIDPADLNWDDDDRLFRLSSGVDTRGIEIGHVIASLVARRRRVAILAEAGPETYGGKMLRYASNTSPLVSGVPTFRYQPGALKNEIAGLLTPMRGAESSAPEVAATLRDSAGVVFFLGVGADMEALIEHAYREKSPAAAQAKLVGIMNAYKLSQLYAHTTNLVRSNLILEVTDFDFIFPFNPPEPAAAFQRMLANNAELSPVLRDQAYSYDEATLLGTAVESAAKAASYSDGLNSVDSYLENYHGRGVTGSIAFSGRKRGSAAPRVVVGQNVGSTILRLAKYQRDVQSWVITSPGML
jgi:hypothetical protein